MGASLSQRLHRQFPGPLDLGIQDPAGNLTVEAAHLNSLTAETIHKLHIATWQQICLQLQLSRLKHPLNDVVSRPLLS